MTYFPRDPAGNAGKDFSVKVPNFLAKSKWYLVKIFERNGELFQMHIVIKVFAPSKYRRTPQTTADQPQTNRRTLNTADLDFLP